MRRTDLGKYVPAIANGVMVSALVPPKLPPIPRLTFNGELNQLQERAIHALGSLGSVSVLLPDETLFIYSYVRKEAVLSSQIEGTKSSLSDLLLFELDHAPGVPIDDVTEVSNYVNAMEHGLQCIRRGHPISNGLICDIHQILLSSGRGHTKKPGEFRKGQVWVGGWDPTQAVLMPPPHALVPDCMAAFEQFLQSDDTGLTKIAKAALAHVQFETIHPFNDGNGRVGRLLITLILCQAGILSQPLLYLSLYLKQNRSEYYSLLTYVRETGDWEKWLAFFFKGVLTTASGAVETAQRLARMFQGHTSIIQNKAGRRAGSVLRVHEALKSRPIMQIKLAKEMCNLSFMTVSSALDTLIEYGMVKEYTGRKRNRFYVYTEYLDILNEGTETT